MPVSPAALPVNQRTPARHPPLTHSSSMDVNQIIRAHTTAVEKRGFPEEEVDSPLLPPQVLCKPMANETFARCTWTLESEPNAESMFQYARLPQERSSARPVKIDMSVSAEKV